MGFIPTQNRSRRSVYETAYESMITQCVYYETSENCNVTRKKAEWSYIHNGYTLTEFVEPLLYNSGPNDDNATLYIN